MNKTNTGGTILLVDSEEVDHQVLKRFLAPDGYRIDSAMSGSEGLEMLALREYDLVLCEVMMPGVDGIYLLREIRKRGLPTEVVMLTGYASLEVAMQSMNYGARSYFLKPFEDLREFRRKIQDAVAAARLSVENRQFYEAMVSGQVDAVIGRVRPRWVINTAAETSVDGCEADPERARRVHVDGTRNLVRACERVGSGLVFISTTTNKTVPVGLITELVRGDVYHWGPLMTGALLASVPVALVYSFFVEHYVAGMTGALKE